MTPSSRQSGGITREMMGIRKNRAGDYITRAIVPGRDEDQRRAYALAATPPAMDDAEAHPGYSEEDLVLRCWAVGVPVWAADVARGGRIGRSEYGHMRSKQGTHEFDHVTAAGRPTQCAGHSGRRCALSVTSIGDGQRRWRHDGAGGLADRNVPPLAQERVDEVIARLQDSGQGAAKIAATPSITQIANLLAALPDESSEPDSSGSRPYSAATSELDVQEVGEVEQAIRRGKDPARRRAVEEHAMDVAIRCYRDAGWKVDDVSATESFDLLCTRGGEELHVEVKGRSTDAATVILTHNEVEHAQDHPTALFVVSNITVRRDNSGALVASGGDCRVFKDPWEPDDNDLTPLAHSYRLPNQT